MAHYFVIGLNHKTASVELREAFVRFLQKDQVFELLRNKMNWAEGIFLSTCNRVEFYGCELSDHESLVNYLSQVNDGLFADHLYELTGLKCIEHLFRVASSLDSMVVGEPQILGQVKEAYIQSKEFGLCGPQLSKLFEKALFVAKKVRSETEISLRPVSVGSVAVDLALKVFGELNGKKMLIVGAGEIAEQVLKASLDAGITSIDLANRTVQKALDMANSSSAQVHDLTQIPQRLKEIDVLISSVSVDVPLINASVVKQAMKDRKNRPLFLIDLGLPRNIESVVSDFANVYLYNIDDLVGAAEVNKNIRGDEALRAYEILEKEASGFYSFVIHKNPTIQMLGRKLDMIRSNELNKTLRNLHHLSEEDKKAIAILTESLVNKILHDPMIHLKSDENTDYRVHDLVRRLFRLDEK